MASIDIRPATPDDTGLVLAFIRELAEYERLPFAVKTSEDDLRALLFAPVPHAFCDIAELDGAPVGFAFWFYNVSTFEGRRGLYLDESLRLEPIAKGPGQPVARQ